jgi:ribosomal protein S18 acetylase RimI-like enzyme
VILHYRTFSNPDPPVLLDLWNASCLGRAAVTLRAAALLEYFTLAKPYFDPHGLILAEADGHPVGFAHAGFGPSADGSNIDTNVGVTCTVAVLPSHRRRGIGSELLRRCEAYLRQRGAQDLLAGASPPRNPFTFGVYGGSDSPGALDSDTTVRPFLERHGYRPCETRLVFQRSLERIQVPADGRFPAFRQRYEIIGAPYKAATWWRECVLGPVEMIEYRLFDRSTGHVDARMTVWEMETFSQQWHQHAIGVVDLEVPPDLRCQGRAKFLLSQVLRHLSEQYFSLVEMQMGETNTAGVGLLRGLGFAQVDAGRCYRFSV